MIHSGEERAISCCQPHRMLAHRKVSKGDRWEEIKGDGTRCVLRTSSPRVGLSPTPSPPQENNKHWKRRKESSRTVCLIKSQEIEFGNEATWSTRRAGRAPGAPFSWETCDETKVSALPRSRDHDDGRGRRRPERGCRKIGERGQFLFCCWLQPSFQQSFERDG